jgi:tRNA(fMet)-specific endonuclease VapC
MSYLLDTNICVYWLKGDESIEQRSLEIGLGDIAVSFITISELYYGAYKSQKINENITAIKKLESKLGIVDSDDEICKNFGKLKTELEKEGKIIDDADLFIAACALANKLILVTNNEKHFGRIENLKLENWRETR